MKKREEKNAKMVVGVDFDNTIVCCDGVFHRAAREQSLIPGNIAVNKTNVRDYLRQVGKEAVWTELQGLVYGDYIKYAPAFPGVKEFFWYCKKEGIRFYIISHKTHSPYGGCVYDLHESANKWLKAQGFYDSNIGLTAGNIYFELTKEDKINRIRQLGCTYFIDDLPEFLEEPDFPALTERILFDPNNIYKNSGNFQRLSSWDDITKTFISERTKAAKWL